MELFFDEEEAVEELQRRGYRVLKVDFTEGGSSVKNIKELVDRFYACRLYYNEDRKFPSSRNYKEDTKYIHGFVKKRQQLGLDRKTAIKEAVVLIDALFKFEKHLKLREPVMSPRILEIDYIMRRICAYADGKVDEVNEAETGIFVDGLNEIYNKTFVERDSMRASESRARILRRIHEQRDEERGKP